jgi:hypothetical protein
MIYNKWHATDPMREAADCLGEENREWKNQQRTKPAE